MFMGASGVGDVWRRSGMPDAGGESDSGAEANEKPEISGS
jgi:hypothetical protein